MYSEYTFLEDSYQVTLWVKRITCRLSSDDYEGHEGGGWKPRVGRDPRGQGPSNASPGNTSPAGSPTVETEN